MLCFLYQNRYKSSFIANVFHTSCHSIFLQVTPKRLSAVYSFSSSSLFSLTMLHFDLLNCILWLLMLMLSICFPALQGAFIYCDTAQSQILGFGFGVQLSKAWKCLGRRSEQGNLEGDVIFSRFCSICSIED